MRRLGMIVFVVLASTPLTARAGIFSRTPKPNPAERVPELILQLKTNAAEGKRAAAADELRQYDPKSYPEIMTALVDAVGNDKEPSVRAEAASTIGKLRPVYTPAGRALEHAASGDTSLRVRVAARQALLQYQIVGYRSGKGDPPVAGKEPPAAVAALPAPPTGVVPTKPTQTAKVPIRGGNTGEPPLAAPTTPPPLPAVPPPTLKPVPKVEPTPGNYQPLPSAPPPTGPSLDGPSLAPPS